MKLFEDYKIDGVPMLVPDEDVTITQTDLDSTDSGRDESGVMHRFVMRHRLKTWMFYYTSLTAEEYKYMESLFANKTDFVFSYKDLEGNMVNCQAYCSSNSIIYRNAKLGLYKNYSFSIIEC